LSAGTSDGRVAASAGASPNSTPVATEAPKLKSSTPGLSRRPGLNATSNGSDTWFVSVMATYATPSAATPATSANARLSMRSCRTSAERAAPRLRRIAISRVRSLARARKRLATFTHAMRSSIATTAITALERPTSALLNVGCTPASDCRTIVMPLLA